MSVIPTLRLELTDRTLSRIVDLGALSVSIETYGHSTDGGPKNARIRVEGPELALQNLLIYLRGGIKIYAADDEPVWWGCLWSVTIFSNKIKYGLTLDGMANKIKLIYLQQTINQEFSGAGTQAETSFSSDSASVSEYGTFEKRIRASNLSETAAAAELAKNLANLANPISIGTTADRGNKKSYAILICRGWIETLALRYYTNDSGNAAGFERNEVTSSEALQLLGMGQPAKTTVAFTTNNFIEDTSAGMLLAPDVPYNYFFIEGSASNNKAWQVLTSTELGRKVTVTPTNVATEAAGASVVIKHVGQQIFQTFQLSSDNPFYVAAVDVRLQKGGSPTDNVIVGLYTVTSGTPDTLLASGTISNSEIQTSMSWLTAVMGTPALVSFGSIYGIQVSRSGTADTNFYFVGVDTGLNYSAGTMTLYTNSTLGWVSRPTNADLIFRIAGIVETTTQISTILTSVGEFVTSAIIDTASGLRTLPYRDGTETARQIISALARAGTSANKRLLTKVNAARQLIVYQEPTTGSADDFILGDDGHLYGLDYEEPKPDYRCSYGQWAAIHSLELAQVPTTKVFIDEVEYNVKNNELRIVRTRDRGNEIDVTEFR